VPSSDFVAIEARIQVLLGKRNIKHDVVFYHLIVALLAHVLLFADLAFLSGIGIWNVVS